jgi:hypothetical protein
VRQGLTIYCARARASSGLHLHLPTHLTEFSTRVNPVHGEVLNPESRVNYGKAYAVEHNVKFLKIGMVTANHQYMIEQYNDAAIRGQ